MSDNVVTVGGQNNVRPISDFVLATSSLTGGTANTGSTAVEAGDATCHKTVLAVSQENASGLVTDDNAALASGYLLYTFPAGDITIYGASIDIDLTSVEHDGEAAEFGLGTVIGSGAVAVLDGTATFESILTGQTAALGTAKVSSSDTVLTIAAASAHTVYFNLAGTWADTAGTDDTLDIAGTVTIQWSLAS